MKARGDGNGGVAVSFIVFINRDTAKGETGKASRRCLRDEPVPLPPFGWKGRGRAERGDPARPAAAFCSGGGCGVFRPAMSAFFAAAYISMMIGRIIGRRFVFSYRNGPKISVISFLISDHMVVFFPMIFSRCFLISDCASLIKSPDSRM